MPRERSSSLPRGFSVAGSPPRIRYHAGDDSRQKMDLELRTLLSNTIYSNKQRDIRNSFAFLQGETREDQELEVPKYSSDRQAVMPPPTPGPGESETVLRCGPDRSDSTTADFSDSELDPQDSISNTGLSPSEHSRNRLFQPPPGWCNIHNSYMSNEFFDPKYRAWIQVIKPRVRIIATKLYPNISHADITLPRRTMNPAIVTF